MPDRGRLHVQPLVPSRMDVTIEGRIGQAELARLVEHVRGLVNAGQADVVCDVIHARESDLGTVAALARPPARGASAGWRDQPAERIG